MQTAIGHALQLVGSVAFGMGLLNDKSIARIARWAQSWMRSMYEWLEIVPHRSNRPTMAFSRWLWYQIPWFPVHAVWAGFLLINPVDFSATYFRVTVFLGWVIGSIVVGSAAWMLLVAFSKRTLDQKVDLANRLGNYIVIGGVNMMLLLFVPVMITAPFDIAMKPVVRSMALLFWGVHLAWLFMWLGGWILAIHTRILVSITGLSAYFLGALLISNPQFL